MVLARRWGCPECGASQGIVAERRAVEEARIAFLATPDGGWSEVIEPDAAGGGHVQARYRCRRCLATFAAPAPLPRSWYA